MALECSSRASAAWLDVVSDATHPLDPVQAAADAIDDPARHVQEEKCEMRGRPLMAD